MLAGSRVSNTLVAAFSALDAAVARSADSASTSGAASSASSGGARNYADHAVGRRCWEMLGGMTPLLADLALLAVDGGDLLAVSGEDAEAAGPPSYWAAMLQHYHSALVPKYMAAAEGSSTDSNGSGGGAASSSGARPLADIVAAGLRLRPGAAAGGGEVPGAYQLSQGMRLAVAYRVYKKMVLWDVILALGLRPEQLQGAVAAPAVAAPPGERQP